MARGNLHVMLNEQDKPPTRSMRVGLSAGLDPKRKNESDRTGHGLRKQELLALSAQGLEAKKA